MFLLDKAFVGVPILLGVLSLTSGCYQYHDPSASSDMLPSVAPAAMGPNVADRTDLPLLVNISGSVDGPVADAYLGYEGPFQLCTTVTPMAIDGGTPPKPQQSCIDVEVSPNNQFSTSVTLAGGDFSQLFGNYEFALTSNYYGTGQGNLVSVDCCQLSSDGNYRVATINLKFTLP